MNIMKRVFTLYLLAATALLSLHAVAANIDVTTAQTNALSYLKQRSISPMLKSVSPSDLRLAHAQASTTANGANAYYAFNIKGGGFILVSGDDRAYPVLGYSEGGRLDFNNLPVNVRALLDSYQEEIEYLQARPDMVVTPAPRATGGGVNPLIRSHWGQEIPYCLQCPVYQGEYCVVGCVATAMTQVMHYWQYPTTTTGVNSYFCYDLWETLPALPGTTFEYNKMLNSYCHWDYDQHALIQDTYTDEQAQAVAKLARYCGQAVQMGYSPEGSGAYVSSQLTAMRNFGYSQARDVSRSSWWETNYTTEEWEAMIKAELDAGRPILYSASDPSAGGHAFVCDGYNADGLFHFNFGWYGTCDGWYRSTALNMTHRDGDELHFNSSHEMLINLIPPTYCVIDVEDIVVPGTLMVLGESMNIEASHLNIMTTYSNINLLFSLCNDNGRRVASSDAVNVVLNGFEQGSDLTSSLTLPRTLETGHYPLKMYYYNGNSSRDPNLINVEGSELTVVGNLAKFDSTFSIGDVTTAITYLLKGTYDNLNIADITTLINYILSKQ